MRKAGQGWSILVILVVMTILMLLATNGFKIASNIFMTAHMRTRYHQELRLLKGLLTYGIYVCQENRVALLSWGMQTAQTMGLTFDPWPSQATVSVLGPYTGSLSIMSQKGMLYLNAHLERNKLPVMSGTCIVRPMDPKKPDGQLVSNSWHIQH